MSDQNGGEGEQKATDTKPVGGPDAPSGRTRAAPVIEGQAAEIPPEVEEAPEDASHKPTEEPAPEADAAPTTVEAAMPEDHGDAPEAGASEPEAHAGEPQRKSGVLRALGALVGVAVLGAGGYYGWTEIGSPAPADIPAKIAALLTPSGIKPDAESTNENAAPAETRPASAPNAGPSGEATKKAEGEPGAPPAQEKNAPSAPSAAETSAAPAPSAAAEAPGVEAKPKTEAAPEKASPPAAAQAEKPAPAPAQTPSAAEATQKTEAPAAKEVTQAPQSNAEFQKNAAANPAAAPAEPAKAPAAETPADKTLVAQMAAQLATTQATVQQLSQKLKAVEDQLAAPKPDTGEASAKLVVAQSLLTAIRQGDNYAPMLTALQSIGGASDRLAQLRAGLAAPSAKKLAEEFAGLAPKLMASAAPPAPKQQTEAKSPQNFGLAALAYIRIPRQNIGADPSRRRARQGCERGARRPDRKRSGARRHRRRLSGADAIARARARPFRRMGQGRANASRS